MNQSLNTEASWLLEKKKKLGLLKVWACVLAVCFEGLLNETLIFSTFFQVCKENCTCKYLSLLEFQNVKAGTHACHMVWLNMKKNSAFTDWNSNILSFHWKWFATAIHVIFFVSQNLMFGTDTHEYNISKNIAGILLKHLHKKCIFCKQKHVATNHKSLGLVSGFWAEIQTYLEWCVLVL